MKGILVTVAAIAIGLLIGVPLAKWGVVKFST
jgi:hypothetical protein